VNPIYCDNVTIQGLTIQNPTSSPNTDGINPDSCSHVHISNCHIDVGDDCITLKSGSGEDGRRVGRPCEKITITNCTMVHGHGGVVIGSEMSGGVRNVVISNCVFVHTDRGIRLKSRRGRGGTVEDIRVSNIVMQHVYCPFVMNLYYHCGEDGKTDTVRDKSPRPVTEETPCFRNIHFGHITAREVTRAAGFFYGLPERPIEDVTFSNIAISTIMKPGRGPGKPAMMDDEPGVEGAGFFARNVKGLRFRDVQIDTMTGPALVCEGATDLDLAGLRTQLPHPDAPVARLRNAKGAYVHDCYATPDTVTFLEVSGSETEEVVIRNNHFVKVVTPVIGMEDVPEGSLVVA
jgi:polygalacturonase